MSDVTTLDKNDAGEVMVRALEMAATSSEDTAPLREAVEKLCQHPTPPDFLDHLTDEQLQKVLGSIDTYGMALESEVEWHSLRDLRLAMDGVDRAQRFVGDTMAARREATRA